MGIASPDIRNTHLKIHQNNVQEFRDMFTDISDEFTTSNIRILHDLSWIYRHLLEKMKVTEFKEDNELGTCFIITDIDVRIFISKSDRNIRKMVKLIKGDFKDLLKAYGFYLYRYGNGVDKSGKEGNRIITFKVLKYVRMIPSRVPKRAAPSKKSALKRLSKS